MDTLVFLIKSYDRHLEWTKHLVESINKHNKDNIKVYLSIPKKDIGLFKNSINTTNCEIISDEDVVKSNITQNWYTQQLVKMKFSEFEVCKNYFWIDADSYFIKDFFQSMSKN